MNELDELFKQLAEAKAQDPKQKELQKLKEEIHESVKGDLSSLFAELASLKKKPKEVKNEEIKVEPIVEEVQPLIEVPVVPVVEQEIPAGVDKYLTDKSFQQPNPDRVDPSIKAIQDKMKFIEQWLGKIAATGPGGGAAEIYNLDMPTKQVTGDYSIGRKDYYIGVNADVKTYITLPEVGENVRNGRVIVIKDESGHAQLTPIKIVGNIDNDPNGAEIRINNGAVQLIYRNGSWRII